jgi:hypothetical protein
MVGSRRLEHDPEKHALGLDPRLGTGFPKTIMLRQKIERDDDSTISHLALVEKVRPDILGAVNDATDFDVIGLDGVEDQM